MCLCVIFLDIDGVLNKGLVVSASPPEDVIKLPHGWMNRSLVDNLNRLTSETSARLVISSSWRRDNFEDTKLAIKKFGVDGDIIGQTPELGRYTVRGNEVRAWIENNIDLLGVNSYRDFKRYIILDDSEDMLLSQAFHYVKTDSYAGLSEAALVEASRKLKTLTNSIGI